MNAAAARRTAPSARLIIALAAAVAVAGGVIIVRNAMNEQPPSSTYTQAEAYAPMERAVAEIVEFLPDFPGFEQRSWAELPCSREGVDDDAYVNVEIRYRFSLDVSATPLVREIYVQLLRERWGGQGYEIHRDDERAGAERIDHSLEARRGDGINLWYAVGGYTGLFVQSGCVPKSEPGEIAYIPPTGGIVPGSSGDAVERYFPDGIPFDEESTQAVNPFERADRNPYQL